MAGKKPPGENTGKPRGYENLRPPFPKGVSGNPGGRPKCRDVNKALRRFLKRPAAILADKDLSKYSVAELLALQAIGHAVKGKSAYFRELMNRLYGRVPLPIEQSPESESDRGLTEAQARAVLAALKSTPSEEQE